MIKKQDTKTKSPPSAVANPDKQKLNHLSRDVRANIAFLE